MLGNVTLARRLGAELDVIEGERECVTLGSKLDESLGEALCIPLGVNLGNVTLARWLGVELDVAEGDRECASKPTRRIARGSTLHFTGSNARKHGNRLLVWSRA
jgi:hypothetical protein